MRRMSPAPSAKLLKLQALRRRFFVFGRRVIPAFALRTFESNDFSHRILGPSTLFQNLSNGAGAYRLAPLPNRKP